MIKPHTKILGVNISATTYNRVLQNISRWVKAGARRYVCVAAVHLVMECQQNPVLLRGVNRANIITPDGMPLVWLSRFFGAKKIERVYGPTLMLKICSVAQVNGWKIFLLGGASGQVVVLFQKLKLLCPRLKIVGFLDTPKKTLSLSENKLVIQKINRSNAHIVFVGMGCPHQELWMINNRKKINANVLIGIGAAFNFISGHERQAPPFFQRMGLEWFFRFIQNPRRLWYRYIVLNIQFLFLLLLSIAWRKNKFIKSSLN